MKTLALGSLLLSLLVSCGGVVVVDSAGTGAGGASATSSSSSSGTSVTTGGAPTPCTDHADCPGGLCIFWSGTCAAACEAAPCVSCGPGSICDTCATSSCPECEDCKAACAPALPGDCDEDDGCPAGEVCFYPTGLCVPACDLDGACPNPGLVCDNCATGSCCGCENCISACVGVE